MADLDFSAEQGKLDSGYKYIVGVDEVGRGPWAGPVVAAAVILDANNLPEGLNDSKKLSAKKREVLSPRIHKSAMVSIAEASVEEIDELNIRQATFLAMSRAVAGLGVAVDFVFVDGNAIPPQLVMDNEAVIKGDGKVLSIAAASIVAKVYRDNLMVKLGEEFPYYSWASNAGYGTKAHQQGLAKHGITLHHRKSFAPIRALL